MLKKLIKVSPYLILSLSITIAYTILDGIVYVRMMKLLDYGLNKQLELLKVNIAPLIILALLLIPIGIIDAYFNGLYKKKGNEEIKKYYVAKVFNKNIAEFQKENNAKYISTLTNDCNTLETNLIEAIHSTGAGFANFAVGMWILSTVNPWLILMAIGIAAVNTLVSHLTSKPLKKATKERSDLFDGYTSYIKEILSAFHIVKSNDLQDKVTTSYYEKSDEIQYKGYVIERLYSFVDGIQRFFMNGSFYGVLCGMGYLAALGKLTAASLLLIVEGMQRMTWPLFQITENLPKLFTAKSLIDKIEATLKNMNRTEESIHLSNFESGIVFKDVSFSYPDDERKILTDVNLELKKNGKYLIIGPSGGGKSTLLKLLRKYFEPTTGTIFIDGLDLKDVIKEDYFKLMANVEQQVFIFEDTLRNNITLYKDYSQDEIKKAIQDAGLSDFVEGLENGLDTVIYDNGRNISGGERSRIVIARALLSKAKILFMDEAFAALDLMKAKEIEQTILAIKDITVINVSHVIFQDTKDQYDRIIRVKGSTY